VVKPAIHLFFAISTICALSAPSVKSLTYKSLSFVIAAASKDRDVGIAVNIERGGGVSYRNQRR